MLYQSIETPSKILFEGYCIAGVASSFKWTNTDMMFDLGMYDTKFLHTKHLFLSHLHGDHVTGIFQLIADRCLHSIKDTLNIYVPAQVQEEFSRTLLGYNAFTKITPRYKIIGVSNTEEYELNSKYNVRILDVCHTVPSVGYTILEKRKALKQEYKSLTGKEIASIAQQGITVNEEKLVNQVTYIGDSTTETLYNHPEVGESKVLFVEATYINDLERATKGGHTEIHQLVEPLDLMLSPECHLVIKHTSNRYTKDHIRFTAETVLKKHVNNMSLFMSQLK